MMVLQHIRRYLRRRDGATAVEFALLALPLVTLIFGLLEICMVFTKQGVLEYATSQAARKVRTGQAQQSTGDSPEEVFQQALCESAAFLIDCDDVQYQVQSMEDFAEANDAPPPTFDEDGNLENQAFDPGGSNGVVMIRTTYRHPIITPLMQPLLANGGTGSSRLMISTVVLQTEPYEFNN